MIYTLLVLFQIKHFIADFPLQTYFPFMMGKFKEKDWVLPLLSHAGVHFVFTFIIAIYFVNFDLALFLAVTDMITHFYIDRLKASPKLLGRWKIDEPMFWNTIGFDQMLHHLTHYLIIYLIMINV